MTHQEKESIVFVSKLMPNEVSKNAVNAINGTFKVMIGPKMKTLDKKIPTNKNLIQKWEKSSKIVPSMVFIGVSLNFGILEYSRI